MKILHADDHPMLLVAVRHLLEQLDAEIEVISAESFADTLHALSRHKTLDLLLLDLEMPDTQGISGFYALREQWPDVKIAIISGTEEPDIVNQALNNGAVGFIPKSHDGTLMQNALKLILAGGIYVPGTLSLQTSSSSDITLSERQRQVLELIATGASNKEIAAQLFISEGTVKVHVNTILKELGVKNRTQAVLKASQQGIISV